MSRKEFAELHPVQRALRLCGGQRVWHGEPMIRLEAIRCFDNPIESAPCLENAAIVG